MKRLSLSLLLLSLLSLLARAQPEVPTQVDRLARQYAAHPHNRGLIIGIIRNGTPYTHAYGETQKGNGQPPKPSDLFELGEISGVFTTTLLAKLHREGVLSLEAPLDSLMPVGQRMPVYQHLRCEPTLFTDPDKPGVYACEPLQYDNLVSLRLCDVATHVAGLPRRPTNLRWGGRKNPFAGYGRKDLYAFLNQYPIRFTRGFEYKYSYVGMALAGEALTGRGTRTYEEVLTEKLLVPLKLLDTGVQLTASQRQRLLPGHNRQGSPVPHWDFDVLAPAAGLRSSTNDLLQLLRIHIGLTPDEWFYTARLTQNPRAAVKTHANTFAGLGWLLTPFPETGEEIIWQAGQTGGFATYVGLLPQAGIGIVVLSNSANPVDQMGQAMLRILNQHVDRPLPPRAALPDGVR
ncbi:MAG: beta-lactamase family protein [Cytophagales bacterium]|nr:beta-lactamase family protein [Cytophagales bacterium]